MGLLLLTLVHVLAYTTITCKDTPAYFQLYNNVVEGNYDLALDNVKQLQNAGEEQYIRTIIQQLLTSAIDNTLPFAYKLWTAGEKQIVMDNFPRPYKMVLNQDTVKIVNLKYNLPLKMDVETDSDGDRAVWGDGLGVEKRRLIWRFFPMFENNRVHFKIQGMERKMFMKLNVNTDNIGDRSAFGDSLHVDEHRLMWGLQPVFKNDIMFYRIINQQYGLGLKLASSTDKDSDRRVWGHNGGFSQDPDRFLFHIMSFRDT